MVDIELGDENAHEGTFQIDKNVFRLRSYLPLNWQMKILKFNPYFPGDLLELTLEFYASNIRDLVRFGCVCQQWRDVMLQSRLWIQFNDSQRSLTPSQISHTFLHRRKIEAELNRARIHAETRARYMNYGRKIGFQAGITLSWILSGLAFGILWDSYKTRIQTIGFASLYLFILFLGIALYQYVQPYRERHRDPFSQIILFLIPTFALVLFVSTTFAHAKVMWGLHMLWIKVLIPFYIFFVPFTLLCLYAMVFNCQRDYGILLFTYLLPLIALILYCHHLDHPNDPHMSSYHPWKTIYFIILHLIGLLIYFGYQSVVVLYYIFTHRMNRILSYFTPITIFWLNILGFILTLLLITEFLTPVLLTISVNFIFYVTWIFVIFTYSYFLGDLISVY